MSSPDPTPSPSTRPRFALFATLAVQAVATLALNVPAVVAPVIAPALGLAPQRVGSFVGLAYLAAMLSGLILGARMAALGPMRVSTWALLGSACGLAIAGLGISSPQWLWVWPLAAVLVGAAYGIPNPAASMVLAVHAPPARRGLYFSIKQTGVPIGVGLTGLVVPVLITALPWPWAFGLLAAFCLLSGVLLRSSLSLDGARSPASASVAPPGGRLAQTLGPLARVWADPVLRRLGVASLVYSMMQLCFVTFLVSYLKLEAGLSLGSAAAVLAASQALAVAGRVLWGQVADRLIPPLRLLALLGLGMACAIVALGSLPAQASLWLATPAAMACALTAMAWNGVYFAELAHRVPAPVLGAITGATQFLTFCGAMIGPPLFAELVDLGGRHGTAYLTIAALPAAVGLWLWRGARTA